MAAIYAPRRNRLQFGNGIVATRSSLGMPSYSVGRQRGSVAALTGYGRPGLTGGTLGTLRGGGLYGGLARGRRGIIGGRLGGGLELGGLGGGLSLAGPGLSGGASLGGMSFGGLGGLGGLGRLGGLGNLGGGLGIGALGLGSSLGLGGSLGLEGGILGGRSQCAQDPIYGHVCEGCINRLLIQEGVLTGLEILDGPCTCECCDYVWEYGLDPLQYGTGCAGIGLQSGLAGCSGLGNRCFL